MLRTKLLALLCCLALISCGSSDEWPTEQGWKTSAPEAQGVDSEQLVKTMKAIKKGDFGIESLQIVRNGYLITDAYIAPFKAGTRHEIHSVTKSFMSALIGIAIDKGFIESTDVKLVDFFPDRAIANLDDAKRSITLKHLLMMSAGLEAKDNWEYDWAGLSDMMLSDDWTQHMLDHPMYFEPGERFQYTNGVSYLLSAILQKSTGMKSEAFADQYLFKPLGIKEYHWLSNSQGISYGSWGLNLLPEDMSKFGLLYLNKGNWNGQQIISQAWVEESTSKKLPVPWGGGYAYQWWTYPDYYIADGISGQRIAVVPEKNMVITFTGHVDSDLANKKLIEKFILPAVYDESLAENPNAHKELQQLITEAAVEDAYVWESVAEGSAKGGTFTRTAVPAFKFNYPQPSSEQLFDDVYENNQVMSMAINRGTWLAAGVVDLPKEISKEKFGEEYFVNNMNRYHSDVVVIDNREIILSDDNEAYRTDIEYRWKNIWPSKIIVISSCNNGKCAYLDIDYGMNSKADDMAAIVESLTLSGG